MPFGHGRSSAWHRKAAKYPVLSCKHCYSSLSSSLRARLRPLFAEGEKKASSKDLFKIPGSMDGKIAALAIPALGTELIDPLLSACDTAFVGRLGVEPLAGVALASSVFTISSLGLNFLATASSPLVTQALAGSVPGSILFIVAHVVIHATTCIAARHCCSSRPVQLNLMADVSSP